MLLINNKYTKINLNIGIKISVRSMLHLRQPIKRNFVFGKLMPLYTKKTYPQFNLLQNIVKYKEKVNFTPHLTDTKFPLLLGTDPNKNLISGLMSISPQEYIFLRASDAKALAYKKIITITLAKTLYIFYGMENTLSLWDKFDLLFTTIGFDINKMPELMSIKKYITLLQHVLTYVFYNKTFTYKTLKNFAIPVNCDSYIGQKITPLSFFEAYVIKKNLINNLIDKPYIIHYLVNPDNLQAVPGFSNMESLLQTGQRNSDNYLRNLYNNKSIYADVKTHTVAGFFGRNLLSLCFINEKEFLKLFNNIMTTLKALSKKTTNSILKDNLDIFIKKLFEIKQDYLKTFDLTMMEKVHKELVQFQNNPENAEIRISLNYALDNKNTNFYVLLNKFMHRFEEYNKENLEKLFPTDSQVASEEHQASLDHFISNVFQDDPVLLETIKANMSICVYIEN